MTVTELKAIASPARAGSNVMPNAGYNTPAAIGISMELYANAQNMFSLSRCNVCNRDTYIYMKYFLQVILHHGWHVLHYLQFFARLAKPLLCELVAVCQNALPFFQLSTICHISLVAPTSQRLPTHFH